MTTTPSTPRLAATERRELVLAAARVEFGERGYEAARLDDIAARAGVTKPIVYRHFGSKKELYIAVLARHADDFPSFVEPLPSQLDAAALKAILDGWLDYVRSHHHSWLMLFRDGTGDEDIRAERERVSAEARTLVAALLTGQRPDLDAATVEAAAALLTAGLANLVLWWIDRPDVPKATVLEAALTVCVPVLEGKD